MKESYGVPLEEQLDSYSASAQGSATPVDWTKQWPIYAAAVGSALALGTNAVASIIYSGLQNIQVESGSHQTININGSGFELVLNGGLFTVNAIIDGPVVTDGGAANLASGALISSGLPFAGGSHILRFSNFGGPGGNFPAGVSGFAGVKAGADLGWIRLKVDGIAPTQITAIDWAYNDVAGASILAGQVGAATPEPGTMSMALLAAGAAGVLAWRRRRNIETGA